MPSRVYALLLMLCIMVLAVIHVPSYLSWESFKPGLEEMIAGKTGLSVDILGPIEVELLPRPRIIAKNIHLYQAAAEKGEEGDRATQVTLLRANTLLLGFSLQPLLAGNMVFTDMTLRAGTARWDLDHPSEPTGGASPPTPSPASGGNPWLPMLSHLRGHTTPSFTVSLDDMGILLTKKSIGMETHFPNLAITVNLDAQLLPTRLYGSFLYLGEKTSVNAVMASGNPGQQSQTQWDFSSKSLQMHLALAMSDEGADPTWKGELSAKIKNPAIFTKYLIPVPTSPRPNPLSPNQDPLELKGVIALSEKSLTVEGLQLATSRLKGSLAIQAVFGEKPKWDSELLIDQMELGDSSEPLSSLFRAMIHVPNQQTEENRALGEMLDIVIGDLSKKMTFDLAVNVKKLSYHNVVLAPFATQLHVENGKARLASFDLVLPYGTLLHVAGERDSDIKTPDHHTLFDSDFEFSSTDPQSFYQWLMPTSVQEKKVQESNVQETKVEDLIRLKGHLAFTNRTIRLYELRGNLGSAQFEGDLSIERHDRPLYDIRLKMAHFDADQWEWGEPGEEKGSVPYIKDQIQQLLAPALTADAKTAPWVKGISDIINIDLSLSDFTAHQSHYDHFELVAHAEDNILRIAPLRIHHKEAEVEITADYDFRPLKPVLGTAVTSTKMTKDYLMQLFPSFSQLTEVATLLTDGKPWSKKEINFPRLDLVDGTFRVICDQLIIDKNTTWTDVSVLALMRDEKILLERLGFEHGDSRVGITAQIGFEPMTLIGSFIYGNFKFSELPPALLPQVIQEGYGSMSGTYATSGSAPAAWVDHLSLSMALAFRNMVVKGIAIDDFVQTLNNAPIRNAALVEQAMEHARNPEQKTHIINMDGALAGADGVFQLKEMLVDSRYSRTAFNGSIDLGKQTLAIKGKNAFSLLRPDKKLVLDLALTGPFLSPTLVLDVGRLAKEFTGK